MRNLRLIKPTRVQWNITANREVLLFRQTNGIRKIVLSILRRLGWVVEKDERFATIESFDVEMGKLLNVVLNIRNELYRSYDIHDLILIIGSKQFMEINKQLMTTPFMFTVPNDFCETKIAGLITCVLPWIDGVVLVPRDYWPLDTKVVEVIVAMTPEMAKDERERAEGDRAAMLWNQFMGRTVIERVSDEDDIYD